MCDLTSYLTNATGKETPCQIPMATAGWNFPADVCRSHYKIAEMLLESNSGTLGAKLGNDGTIKPGSVHVAEFVYDPEYLADSIKLLALMQNRTAVKGFLRTMNQEITRTMLAHEKSRDDLDDRFQSPKENRGYVRLSRVLSYYEQYCWFPSSHVVFSGALTTDNFLYSLRAGYMPKDPGAGLAHGDLSHRLQWHAVMRAVTNNFASPIAGSWKKSPIDLFTSLGSGSAQQRGAWGVIFDSRGRPNYSDPSNLYEDLQKDSEMGVVGKRLQKTYKKRQDVEKGAQACLDEVLSRPDLTSVRTYLKQRGPKDIPPAPQREGVASIVYHWKKIDHPEFNLRFNAGEHPTIPAYAPATGYAKLVKGTPAYNVWEGYLSELAQLAAYRFWEKYIADNRSELGHWMQGSRKTKYVPDRSESSAPVAGILVADDPDRMIGGIRGRVAASYTGFNRFYQYGSKYGISVATQSQYR